MLVGAFLLLLSMKKEAKLAVLIDGDNIPAKYVKELLEEVSKYGTPTLKRIYADWTKPQMAKWKAVLLENAVTPVQQYAYTTGKNATDSAMIIDAMDILYSDSVDGFCLVSSDSDFTKLATRLREAGMNVYGLGEKKTPNPFIVACDKFIYLEILKSDESDAEDKAKTKKRQVDKITNAELKFLRNCVTDTADEDGWAFLGDVGSLILKKRPNFDARNYGYEKLSALFKSTKQFEMERREAGNNRNKLVYIRKK